MKHQSYLSALALPTPREHTETRHWFREGWDGEWGKVEGGRDLTVGGSRPLPVLAGLLVRRVVEAPEPAPDRPFVLPLRAVAAVTI